jgi:nuclear transport factor 2 (NTF2) superfamily protein
LEQPRSREGIAGLHARQPLAEPLRVHHCAEIVAFLRRKWAKELDYRLIKELWAFTDSRIAVCYVYEWHDDSGNWFRSYGNENWEFD